MKKRGLSDYLVMHKNLIDFIHNIFLRIAGKNVDFHQKSISMNVTNKFANFVRL